MTLELELGKRKTLSFKNSSSLLINILIYVTIWVFFFNSGEILLCMAPNLSARPRSYMGLDFLPILLEQTNCFNKLFMFISRPSPCNLRVLLSESLLIWIYLWMRPLFTKIELLPSCSPFIKLFVDGFAELNLFGVFLSFFLFTFVRLFTLLSFFNVLLNLFFF